jgi:hypothetical protein
MAVAQRVSDLFKPEPAQWGLRGDPYLWEEMASVLSDVPLPPTEAQLSALLEETFSRLVGSSLDTSASSVFVERYSRGGMSSGHVSLGFWQETGFPLLRSRYVGNAFKR